MLKVLITGGTGLVGKAIESINDNSYEYIYLSSKDGDLRNIEDVRAIFRKYESIYGVIHLAANVGGLFKNMKFPVEMINDNLLINTNVLQVSHEFNVENVICALSTCIFPDNYENILTFDDLHKGPPHSSNEGYAYAKRILEVQCRAYQNEYNRRYFCFIPTNIYGPNDNFNLENSHVIPGLIHKCYLAKKNNTNFIVAGDGSPLRQFIFSHDLAKLIIWAFKNYSDIKKSLMMIPPHNEYSIKDVSIMIANAMKFPIEKIIFDTSLSNGQYKKTAEVYKNTDFNFTELNEGIIKTVEWFCEHY
jgi:GDP-L-fucose synthase